MALTAGAIYAGAVAATAGILAATREEALLAGPEYIRDADPEGITKRIGLGLARQTCRAYADGNTDVAPARAAQFENACRPYLDSVGYGEGPTLLKEFDGGQCPGINYTVTITSEVFPFSDCSTFGPSTSSNGFTGPIRGLRFGVENPSGELCTPGRNTAYLVHGAPGNETVVAGAGFGVTASIVSVVREDGLPDDCGGPSPIFEPPTPPENPGAPFQPIIVVPIVNIDAGVIVNLDGTVDITIDGVEFTIDPFGDGGGGEPGGGGVGPDDLVPDGGLAGSPADTGNGGVASGDAPPGNELVGVRVEVLEAPIGFNQYANNAAVVYRGIGYVRMGYSGRLALDVGASAVISPQFFLAPVRGLTSWEHRANTGFINRVTPFYRELPS